MAEILLSLTIIGVVAAITLPSLTGNINERTWNTQRKALYARFSQAIALMPALNGYGTLDDTNDTAAETFVTAGLSKVLKINNICDSEHLADCGIPAKITTLDAKVLNDFTTSYKTLADFNNLFSGSAIENEGVYEYHQQNTKAAAFETANGESILVYYNPYCTANEKPLNVYYLFMQPLMCANFIYDLNGKKGPNTVGKDIGFMAALYPSDSVVLAPMPLPEPSSYGASSMPGAFCRKMNDETRTPGINELAVMFYNKRLLGDTHNGYFVSSELISPDRVWHFDMNVGCKHSNSINTGYRVWCVRR